MRGYPARKCRSYYTMMTPEAITKDTRRLSERRVMRWVLTQHRASGTAARGAVNVRFGSLADIGRGSAMSALPLKADMSDCRTVNVRYVPKAEVSGGRKGAKNKH